MKTVRFIFKSDQLRIRQSRFTTKFVVINVTTRPNCNIRGFKLNFSKMHLVYYSRCETGQF